MAYPVIGACIFTFIAVFAINPDSVSWSLPVVAGVLVWCMVIRVKMLNVPAGTNPLLGYAWAAGAVAVSFVVMWHEGMLASLAIAIAACGALAVTHTDIEDQRGMAVIPVAVFTAVMGGVLLVGDLVLKMAGVPQIA